MCMPLKDVLQAIHKAQVILRTFYLLETAGKMEPVRQAKRLDAAAPKHA